jgi:tRNA-Thr(GGU) m(6)t(6)A37 methyltransferase TsaA
MNDEKNPYRTFVLYPVGVVKSPLQKPALGPCDGDISTDERVRKARKEHQRIKSLESEVTIFPEYEGILEGIRDFTHILVLYWPHLNPEERRKLLKVRPMGRRDMPEKGVFATLSPARPNPVLVSAVRLLSCEGMTLRVEGLEALDGSPIIDIKPFVQLAHGAANPSVPDWMQKIHEDLERIE